MDFQTIYATQLPTEANVIKSKLESEGFLVHLKDELTVQNYNFISNAVGGVKIQVEESKAVEAAKLLAEFGYIMEIPEELNVSKFTGNLSNNTVLAIVATVIIVAVGLISLLGT